MKNARSDGEEQMMKEEGKRTLTFIMAVTSSSDSSPGISRASSLACFTVEGSN